jgi:hypothetical protein
MNLIRKTMLGIALVAGISGLVGAVNEQSLKGELANLQQQRDSRYEMVQRRLGRVMNYQKEHAEGMKYVGTMTALVALGYAYLAKEESK